MNPKTTIFLVVALVVAVVGVWWAQSSSRQETRPRPAGPKELFDPPVGELTGFELKVGDAPALAFVMEDAKWRMTAPVSGPSEHWSVNGDVSKIKALKYVRTYAKDDPDRPTAGMSSLDAPRRIIKLTEASGKAHVLKIGARQALSNKTYVQKEGEETIYLVDTDLNKDLRKGLSDYRGKRVAEYTQADAVRIEVTGERGYTLVKSDGKWMLDAPVKGRVEMAKVNSILSGVSSMRVLKFVDDAPRSLRPYGLAAPRLSVAVTTETKKPKPPPEPPASAPAEPEFDVERRTVRVAFGGSADDEVFAKIDEASSPAVFQVARSSLDQVGPPLVDLRSKQITAINTHRAQRIAISMGGESVVLVRSGADWRIEAGGADGGSAEAEFAAVDDLLKAVRELKAMAFESEESSAHGFDAPRATIEITAEGQLEPAKLLVGRLTQSKTGAYVRNEREGFTAVVKAEAAEKLLVRPIAFMSRELVKFAQARASRIELARPGGTCVVSREGSTWRFVSPIEGRAEAEAVIAILKDLAHLRGRRVAGLASEAADFGLDSPAVEVMVTVDGRARPLPTTQPADQEDPAAEAALEPASVYIVRLGRHDGKVYAMAATGSTICEVDGKVLDDLEAELFDTRVAELDSSQVLSVAVSAGESFTFEKKDDDWTLAGEPSFATDAAKVTEVCDALRDLRAKRYIRYSQADPAAYGLSQPAVVVTAQSDDGAVLTLTVSAEGPGGGDRYAVVSAAQDRVFVLSADDVAKFERGIEHFEKAG